jgi:23S rRNA pseudouridine955/2504/2580 synthase
LYQLIRTGKILVDGKRVKQTRKLQIGEKVRVPVLENRSTANKSVPDRLAKAVGDSILLEHEDFFVLNKPAGLAVHGGSGLAFGLIDALRQLQADKKLELSHRLDRATSGCLLVGRNLKVNRELQNLFRERQIDKHYVALVDGIWPADCRQVSAPLLKNVSHAGERRVVVDPAGQPANTHFAISATGNEATLMDIQLDTGRTHQIRVHARHIGHCVIGDERYGNNKRNARYKRLGLSRLFLHASYLGFQWKGERIIVEAPTDTTWDHAVQRLNLCPVKST